jgi:formylglycine-generating enzyme required for sulfatase activity
MMSRRTLALVLGLVGALDASCTRPHDEAPAGTRPTATQAALTALPASASAGPLAGSTPDARSEDAGREDAGDAGDAGREDAGDAGREDAGDGGSEDGGADAGDGGAPVGCPPETVAIGKYCVDRYEAHLVTTEGGTKPWPHYERPPEGQRYEARSEANVYPQAYISRVEATRACENAGKRLCSRAEWQRACEGRRGVLYGYANRRKDGTCNSGKEHLLSKLYGTNGRSWKYDEHFNNPELNQLPGFLARAGEYPGCTAGEGVYDMVGNLHEWVSDTVDEGLADRLELDQVTRRSQPMKEGNGIFMGGFFSTTSEHGPGCKFITTAHEPRYHDYSTGFRCCQTPGAKEKKPAKRRKKAG